MDSMNYLEQSKMDKEREKEIRIRKKQSNYELGKVMGVSVDPLAIDKALGDPSRWNYAAIDYVTNGKIKYSWAKPNGKKDYVKRSGYKTAKANRTIVNPGMDVLVHRESPERTAHYVGCWLKFHKLNFGEDHSLPKLETRNSGLEWKNQHPEYVKNLTFGNTGVKKNPKIYRYFNVMSEPSSDYGSVYVVDVNDAAWYAKLMKNVESTLKRKLVLERKEREADELKLARLVTYPKYIKANKLKMKKLYGRKEITLIPMFSISPFHPSKETFSREDVTENVGSRLTTSYFRRYGVESDGTSVTRSSLSTGPATDRKNSEFCGSEGPRYSCIKTVKTLKSPECSPYQCQFCRKRKVPERIHCLEPAKGAKTYVHPCGERAHSNCPKPTGCDSMVESEKICEKSLLCDYRHKLREKRPIDDACLKNAAITPPEYSPDKLCKLYRFFKLFGNKVKTELPQVLASFETSGDFVKFMNGKDTSWSKKSVLLEKFQLYRNQKSKEDEAGNETIEFESENSKPTKDEVVAVVANVGKEEKTEKGTTDMSRERLLRSSSASFVFQIITGEIEYRKYELGSDFEAFLSIFFPKDDLRIMMAVVEIVVPELGNFIHDMLKDTVVMSAVLDMKDKRLSLEDQMKTLKGLVEGKTREHERLWAMAMERAENKRRAEKTKAAKEVVSAAGTGGFSSYGADSDDDSEGGDAENNVGDGIDGDSEDGRRVEKPGLGKKIMGSEKYDDDVSKTLSNEREIPDFVDPMTKSEIVSAREFLKSYKEKMIETKKKMDDLKNDEVTLYSELIEDKKKQYLNYNEFQSTISSLNRDPRASKDQYLNMMNLMAISSRMFTKKKKPATSKASLSSSSSSSDSRSSEEREKEKSMEKTISRGNTESISYYDPRDSDHSLNGFGSHLDEEPHDPRDVYYWRDDDSDEEYGIDRVYQRVGAGMNYLAPGDLLLSEDTVDMSKMFEVAPNSCGINMYEGDLLRNEDRLANHAEVLDAFQDYKNDLYDRENLIEDGILTTELKPNALKPYFGGAFTDEDFEAALGDYMCYDDNVMTETEAGTQCEEDVCNYVERKRAENQRNLARLKMEALSRQCGTSSVVSVGESALDGGGPSTTTVTLTTTKNPYT